MILIALAALAVSLSMQGAAAPVRAPAMQSHAPLTLARQDRAGAPANCVPRCEEGHGNYLRFCETQPNADQCRQQAEASYRQCLQGCDGE